MISVDNMQIINRCKHEPELLAGYEDAFEGTRTIVKAKLPGAFHYLITTFFYPPVRKERTTLAPSILRPEILEAKSEPGEHLLVYQTSTTNTELPDILKQSGLPCRIYGLRRDITEDRGGRQPDVPAVQREGLHRRPAHVAGGGGRRRLHADERGGVPAQAAARRSRWRASSSR